MRKFYVYVHVCPNGKRYVGATTAPRPEYRWKEGRGYGGIFLQDILKYGWDNITHDVFEVDSAEEMYRKEVELISFYHSNDPRYGYNHSMGGEKSALGCIRSKEYRKKMSEAKKKGYLDHPEYRKRISETLKGRPKPRIKIKLPDGTILEMTKQNLARNYILKGKKFEYLSY